MPLDKTPSPVPQNGSAIREIRQREGLTISQLAQAIDVSDPHLRNIETENKPARPEHLARIANRLGCSIASIRRTPERAAS
jgi:transcriptional regulator with XRE-family HTH domain